MTLLKRLIREIYYGPVRAKRYTSTSQEIEHNIQANRDQRKRDERAQSIAIKNEETKSRR